MSKMLKTNELYVPEELLTTNILTKLPIKSLLRFKSVSKRFNSTISSSYFAKLHLKKSNSSNNNSHLLIYHQTCFLSFEFECSEGGHNLDCFPFEDRRNILKKKPGLARIIDGNFHFPHSHVFVIGSYDGLVCFKTKYFLYIWNPTTLKYREIPLLTKFFEKEDWVWGFGCVTSGRDYKIVRICQNKQNDEKIIEIFSLLENRWTLSSEEKMEGFGKRPQLSGLGVSLNNVVYWPYLAYYEDNTRANGKYLWWIVGFDLVTHTLKRIPLPMWVIGGFKNRPIMYVMEGCLCACWEISDSHVVEVATLKEEDATSTWLKLHQVSHDIVLRYMKYFYDQGVPNITTKNRFAVRDSRNRDTILFIDPAQESHKDVLKLRVPNSSKIFNYTESLISPFCNDLKQI